jgi:5'-deoxynucleotidase YfbR-like HD superfamily hydrolase
MSTLKDKDTREGYMMTISGRKFYPLAPNPDDVNIDDIAHALANVCRWGGHVKTFYSVAQHSVFVSMTCHPDNALIGLFHDAAEAYLGDIIRPIKYLPSVYEVYAPIETLVTHAIAMHLGIPSLEKTKDVEAADQICLAEEFLSLRDPHGSNLVNEVKAKYPEISLATVTSWDPPYAKQQFLNRFYELTGVKKQ